MHINRVVQGQGAVRNAAAAQKAAKGAFLPSLSVSTGASLNGNTRPGGSTLGTGVPADATSVMTTSTACTAGVAASMDVFDGGRRSAELSRTRAQAASLDPIVSLRYE